MRKPPSDMQSPKLGGFEEVVAHVLGKNKTKLFPCHVIEAFT